MSVALTSDGYQGEKRAAAGLVVLYVVSVIVYALLGRLIKVPLLHPDEFAYGHLARSLADGDGFTWLGASQWLISALYVFLITPAWMVGTTLTSYAIAKVIGAVVLCAVAVPVFLLARRLLPARLALLTAALSLAGTWMVTSSLLLTENLALPLMTATLCATVMALREPGSRWIWAALGLAVVTALARAQLVVALPIVLLAIGADVARFWPDWRERADRHRTALIAAGAITAALVLLQVASPGTLSGTVYESVREFPVNGDVLAPSVHQWVALVAMTGFVPLLFALVAALTPAAWRSEQIGPLLAVVVPATVVLVFQSGWFLEGRGLEFAIQRYVEYVVPLMLVLFMVVAVYHELIAWWSFAVVGVLALPAFAGGKVFPEETLAAASVGDAGDLLGLSQWTSVAIATLVVGSAGVWLARRGGGADGSLRAAQAVGLLTLAVLLLQSGRMWAHYADITERWRAGFPADLRWLDKTTDESLARLLVTASHPRWPTTEFFNRDVRRVYALTTATRRLEHGTTCAWTADAAGRATFDPACGPAPSVLYVDDPAARVTFVGQRLIASSVGGARVVALPAPPAVTRLRSIWIMPCDDRTLLRDGGDFISYFARECRTVASGYFWLDEKATLVLGVRGGEHERTATIGGRTYAIPPRRVTTIRVPVPKGGSQMEMRFDDLELPLGYPDIDSAELQTGSSSTSIL